MIIKLSLYLLLFLLPILAWASPRVVEIIGVTRSGQSIMIGFGGLEGIVAGQRGYFFSADTIGKIEVMEVAFGEAVKVYPDYSLWFLRSVRDPAQLVAGAKIGLLSEAEAQKGIRKLKMDKRQVVLGAGENDTTYTEDESSNYPAALVRGPEDFELSDKDVTQTAAGRKFDGEDPQFYTWVDGELTEVEGFADKVKFKVKKTFPEKRKKEDVEATMREMAFHSYLKSANQKNLEDQIDIAVTGKALPPSNGVFAQYADTSRRSKDVTAEALRRSRKHGEMWSAGMSDQELRRYIIETGLSGEIRRREEVLGRRLDHELQFRYSQGMFTNATAEGEKGQMLAKSLLFGYETYLQRVSSIFNRMTFGAFFETGLGYYNNNGYNLRAEEYGARFDLSYFPWRYPTEVKEFIPFVSLGTKFAIATCENSYLDNSYLYQLRSLPILSAGIKYRFHAGDELNDFVPMGFGSLFLISYERRQFTTAEVLRDEPIAEVFTSDTLSVQLGMSFYF